MFLAYNKQPKVMQALLTMVLSPSMQLILPDEVMRKLTDFLMIIPATSLILRTRITGKLMFMLVRAYNQFPVIIQVNGLRFIKRFRLSDWLKCILQEEKPI